MNRISTNLPNDNMMFYTRERQIDLNQTQNELAGQTRIVNLRDDPLGAAHATRYQSYNTRLERYSENIQFARDNHATSEGQIRQAVEMLQRVRELSLQGAQGTFSREDLQYMGEEVNQLLEEFLLIANAKNGDGTTLFAGTETQGEAFRAVSGNLASIGRQVIQSVEYIGNIDLKQTEVADGSFMQLNFPGNEVFWAENQQIYAAVDATNYVVQQDGAIFIDGEEIALTQGDNVYAIMEKINRSEAAVSARLDPVRNSLVLETTSPHQLWVQDGPGTSVMEDLGIVSSRADSPPRNIAEDARVFGGSLFDSVIAVRDNLYQGDTIDLGGQALGGVDSALNNLLGNLGKLGAQDARLELAFERTQGEILDTTDQLSREIDVDVAETVTELRMLEYTHRVALQTAARIVPQTLLDFLR